MSSGGEPAKGVLEGIFSHVVAEALIFIAVKIAKYAYVIAGVIASVLFVHNIPKNEDGTYVPIGELLGGQSSGTHGFKRKVDRKSIIILICSGLVIIVAIGILIYHITKPNPTWQNRFIACSTTVKSSFGPKKLFFDKGAVVQVQYSDKNRALIAGPVPFYVDANYLTEDSSIATFHPSESVNCQDIVVSLRTLASKYANLDDAHRTVCGLTYSKNQEVIALNAIGKGRQGNDTNIEYQVRCSDGQIDYVDAEAIVSPAIRAAPFPCTRGSKGCRTRKRLSQVVAPPAPAVQPSFEPQNFRSVSNPPKPGLFQNANVGSSF